MRSTRWKNPTDHAQRVVLHDSTNRKIVVTWEAGETKEVPSEYDRAIQMVDCGQDHCHNGAGKKGGGWFCTAGHSGNVVGGLAPLLVRVGAEDTLDPALDPNAAKKKAAETALLAAAMSRQASDQALVVAASMTTDKSNEKKK